MTVEMSVNEEIRWNTLFKKFNGLEKELLKIMKKTPPSNDYTAKRVCKSGDNLKHKMLIPINKEQKKKRKMGRNQETNCNEKTIHKTDTTSLESSEMINKKQHRGDIAKEIEKKEEQIYETINWAYDAMKLYKYDNKKEEVKKEESEDLLQKINPQNVSENETKPEQKGVILDWLNFMEQNMKDELEKLQKEDKHIENVVVTQINAFSKFMKEILSRLTSIYCSLITADTKNCQFNGGTLKENEAVQHTKELLHKLKDTCDDMKNLFTTITEKTINNDIVAAFIKGIEETKIKETNESVQYILNQIISTYENITEKHVNTIDSGIQKKINVVTNDINTITFPIQEVLEKLKVAYENVKKTYNNTIQTLKNNETDIKMCESDLKENEKTLFNVEKPIRPSKIPIYSPKNKLKSIDHLKNQISTVSNVKKTKNQKEKIEKQSEQKLDNEKWLKCYNEKVNRELIDNVKSRENKRRISVQDVLKQLKNTYDKMKLEYRTISRHLIEKNIEDEIIERGIFIRGLERAKKENEICEKNINKSVVGEKIGIDLLDGNGYENVENIHNFSTKSSKSKILKCLESLRFLSPNKKNYYIKGNHTHFSNKNIFAQFVVNHMGNEKSDESIQLKIEDLYENNNLIDENKSGKKNVDNMLNVSSEKQITSLKERKLKNNQKYNDMKTNTSKHKLDLVEQKSLDICVKEKYNQLTIDTQNLLKKIEQIEENISILEKNTEETGQDKLLKENILKELKFLYNKIKEKCRNCINENDSFKIEIAAIRNNKSKIEQDMTNLEIKIKHFKANELKKKSKFAMKILTELELAYKNLEQDFNQGILNKKRELLDKVTKFINNRKNIKQMIKLLETLLNHNEISNFKGTMNNVIIELITNYDALKKEYNQIINEKKVNIQEEMNNLETDRKKIEQEMSDIEAKLSTFKVYNGDILLQLIDGNIANEYISNDTNTNIKTLNTKQTVSKHYAKQSKMNPSNKLGTVMSKRNCQRQYMKEEQIQTVDDKESQIELDDCVSRPLTRIMKDETNQTLLKSYTNYVEEIPRKLSNFKTVDNEVITLNNQVVKKEEFVNIEHHDMLKIESEQEIEDNGIIRKAEEQLDRIDSLLNRSVINKNRSIVEVAEEQIQRIERYLSKYSNRFEKEEECEEIDFELENHKFDNIRQYKSTSEDTFMKYPEPLSQICNRNVEGQGSGDKPIDFKKKLKVVKLPNQSLYDWQSPDDKEQIKYTIMRAEHGIEQKTKNLLENLDTNDSGEYIGFPNVLNEPSNFNRIVNKLKTYSVTEGKNSELKLVLRTEKETFEELKQVLLEKIDRLDNINSILKRIVENRQINSEECEKEDQ